MANNNALVQWNANTEPDLVGYRLYYGLFPGSYSGFIDVGNVTSTTLEAQFNSDGRWYFAISAYDTSNNESALSSAVSKRITRQPLGLRLRRL